MANLRELLADAHFFIFSNLNRSAAGMSEEGVYLMARHLRNDVVSQDGPQVLGPFRIEGQGVFQHHS